VGRRTRRENRRTWLKLGRAVAIASALSLFLSAGVWAWGQFAGVGPARARGSGAGATHAGSPSAGERAGTVSGSPAAKAPGQPAGAGSRSGGPTLKERLEILDRLLHRGSSDELPTPTLVAGVRGMEKPPAVTTTPSGTPGGDKKTGHEQPVHEENQPAPTAPPVAFLPRPHDPPAGQEAPRIEAALEAPHAKKAEARGEGKVETKGEAKGEGQPGQEAPMVDTIAAPGKGPHHDKKAMPNQQLEVAHVASHETKHGGK
ncbi:MAG: hypothetical protein ACYC9Q_02725, partial [Bacillota bacterium]